MFQPFAWYLNADMAGADTYLNAVPDETVFTAGNQVRVPPDRNFFLGAAAFSNGTTRSYAKIETPSFRPLSGQYVNPFPSLSDLDSPLNYSWQPRSPREMKVAESMQFLMNTDSAAAVDHYGIVWTGDGPQQSVDGNIFTTQLTTAAFTGAAAAWTGFVPTFTEPLPVTTYNVVGMRVECSFGIAARLIFSNSQIRPGCIVKGQGSEFDDWRFRMGMAGVWGAFDINQPPRVELLGAGGPGAVDIYLDLIRTG